MKRLQLFLIVLIVVSGGPLSAQSREVWVSRGVSDFRFPYWHTNRNLGSTDASGPRDDVQINNGFRVGVRFAFNSAGPFGHEFQYAFTRPGLTDSTGNLVSAGPARLSMHQVGYNFLYHFTSSETRIRPIATVGVHFNTSALRGTDLPARYDGKFGFNYGVGLKFRFTPLFGLRGDVRLYETGKPDWGGLLVNQHGLLHSAEASAGLGIYF